MPTPSIPELTTPKDFKDVQNQLIEIHDYLEWLMKHLNHLNVKELYTEYCNIQSEDGETIIKGPVLEQYDKQATPVLRLKQGYDPVTGKFVFELYDALGVKTVGIDSNGAATFTGTITGGTIQTNTPLHSRIVVTGDSLKTYYSNGITDKLRGIAWGASVGANYGDVLFYDSDILTLKIENALASGGWDIYCPTGTLVLGYGGTYVNASGVWDFSTADSVSGLVTDSALSGIYAHSHTVY